MLGILTGATRGFEAGISQCLHITASTKSFFTRPIDEHRHYVVILRPGFKAIGDDVDHLPGEGVQRFLNIEGKLPDHPVPCRMFSDQNAIGHRFFHSGSRFSRNALVPSR